MSVLIVIAEFSSIGENLSKFNKAIGSYSRCQINDATWLIDTSLELAVVRKELCSDLTPDDRLFIFEIFDKLETWNGGRPEQWLTSSRRKWRLDKSAGIFGRLFG